MKTELHYYDIFPKVIQEGKPVTINVKPLGKHAAFDIDYTYTINVCPLGTHDVYTYEIKPCDDGIIRINHTFEGEQEHFIRINKDGNRIVQLAVYSIKADLAGRYPYRGDLHMHTFRSDGRQEPAIVCANYRKYGYDFFAITDHHRYYPSLEAIEAYKDVPIDFNIVPGEEVHLPDNPVHIVNFGGSHSVNGLVETSAEVKEHGAVADTITYEAYCNEVNKLAETLDIPDNLGLSKFSYASCVWAFNKIREAGGLGIYCHPYWISNVFQIPEAFTEYILEQHPFDAYEVLGGEVYYEQNGFQTSSYYEARAKGINFPIVGSTDSHSSVNNDNALLCSTIVFSPENTREALVSSVKDYYSVAIDTIDVKYRLVGDFRLVKYGCFLLDNYFPIHDDLCHEEGRLMKDYICGYEDGKSGLEFVAGRMDKLRKRYFAFD